MPTDDQTGYTKQTTIEREDRTIPSRSNAPWALKFTSGDGQGWTQSNVEFMTQGELITLWQQIGVLFNLAGMRDELTEEEIEKMGVHRGK